MLNEILVNLKQSYVLVPIIVLIVIVFMRLDEKLFCDEESERPQENYVKASILAALLAFAFIYIHCIDDSHFDVGITGVPTF